jgi:hypothetical protein
MPVLGPFPTTLRGASFADQTGTSGVSSTTTFVPFANFRIPLGQAYEFLPSTQFTPQQHYWAQNFVTTVSGNPAVGGGASARLERRDATGQLIFDIIDSATVADIPTFAQSIVVTQKRFFGHRTLLKQDEYLYISLQSVTSSTIAAFNTSDVLIRAQYWVKS